MPKSNRTKRKVKNRSKARRAQVKRKRARHNKTTQRGTGERERLHDTNVTQPSPIFHLAFWFDGLISRLSANPRNRCKCRSSSR